MIVVAVFHEDGILTVLEFEDELAMLTGDELDLGFTVTSTGPSILIHLETDESEAKSGFLIEYNAGKKESKFISIYVRLNLYQNNII